MFRYQVCRSERKIEWGDDDIALIHGSHRSESRSGKEIKAEGRSVEVVWSAASLASLVSLHLFGG